MWGCSKIKEIKWKDLWNFIKSFFCYISCSIPNLFFFFIKTSFAFFCIALFLFILKSINENWYKELTYWANQKPVPQISGCTFIPLPPSKYESDSKYDYYKVIITSDIKDKIGSTIIFPKTEYLIILDEDSSKENYYNLEPIEYLIRWKKKLSEPIKVTVRTEKNFLHFKEKKILNAHECPLQAEIIYDE